MNRVSQVVANAEHSAEGVGTHTQMCLLAQEFQRVTFLLQWIFIRVSSAVNFYTAGLHFHCLALALRCHKVAFHMQTRPCGNRLQGLLVEFLQVYHYLQVLYCGAIVKCHKLHVLVAATSANPALYAHFAPHKFRVKDINYFCSFQFHYVLVA